MLTNHAPFPEAGSYALRIASTTNLVRIIQHDRATGEVIVSYPLRPGASGNARIPADTLQDGTELTAAEHAELDELVRYFASGRRIRTQADQEKKARHDALRLRRIYSRVLAEKLERAGLLQAAA